MGSYMYMLESTLKEEKVNTHWLPGVPHWRVKSSGVRQSKILSLARLGRFGRQRVN